MKAKRTKAPAPMKPLALEIAAGDRVTLVGPLRVYGFVEDGGGGSVELPAPPKVAKAKRKSRGRRPYIETLRAGRF